MSFTKQFLLVLFFVKIVPVFFYPYTFDDFLYSNEEIAIAILFILFIATVEKFFGQTFFDALMEKKNYLRELHTTFTKETSIFLKKQKETLEGIEEISQTFPFTQDRFLSESIRSSLKKKLEENQINQFYEVQLSQLLQSSTQDYAPMSFYHTYVFNEEFVHDNLLWR